MIIVIFLQLCKRRWKIETVCNLVISNIREKIIFLNKIRSILILIFFSAIQKLNIVAGKPSETTLFGTQGQSIVN